MINVKNNYLVITIVKIINIYAHFLPQTVVGRESVH